MAGRTGFGRPPTRFGGSWLVCGGCPTRFGGSRPVSEGCPTRFEGSRPVSEGCPTRFGGSRGPGKLGKKSAGWFWQGFLGGRGGKQSSNRRLGIYVDLRSEDLCTRRICRTVGKRSKLYASQPGGPSQGGAGGLLLLLLLSHVF
jgi:hypothetical protein